MIHPTIRRPRAPRARSRMPLPRVIAVLLSLMALAAAVIGTAPAGRAGTTLPAPAVIPALQSWTPATGSLVLSGSTRIVADGQDSAAISTARTFASDLRAERGWPASVVPVPGAAKPGDIVLRHDTSRSDLGAEGYALTVGQQVTITGATSAGLFYGTRTVLQMLAAGDQLPAGSTVDVPKYAERGVAVCACYTYDTIGWVDRLIKDMGYLKLNYLHLELKVRSTQYPAINTFSYYTPAEIRGIVALAAQNHITVVPEINSPGHADPYIENYPSLQLTGTDGAADPTRLDITKPAAFTFYTSLIDEDLQLFPGPYFHMGADEYMNGNAWADYPQLLAYARAKFGPHAVAQDAYIDFINRVDAYVRSKGKTLRIWNDGLTGANTIPLNKDIIVEYWASETVTPQDLISAGNPVMNASEDWYYNLGGSTPDAKGLYESGWSPLTFPGQTLTGQAGVTGAEFNVWPNNYGKETQNTVQTNMFMPLRVFAQEVWGSPRPSADYGTFQQLASKTGHAPGWGPAWEQPLKAGSYAVTGPDGVLASPSSAGRPLTVQSAPQTWQLVPTADGYYRMISESSTLCADLTRGTPNPLGVVEQAGAPVTAEACDGSTTQEWQVERVSGGYRIVNAITQEAASAQAGTVVQEPRDVAADDVWQVTPSPYVPPTVTVQPASSTVQQGQSTDVKVTINNTSGGILKDAELTMQSGSASQGTATQIGTIPAGATVTEHTTFTAPTTSAGSMTLTADVAVTAQGIRDQVTGTAPVTVPLPAPWKTYSSAADAPVAYGQDGQQFSISGAGKPLFSGYSDNYSAIYQPAAAGTTSTIETEVTGEQDMSNYWAQAGIMVRNDMTASGTGPEGVTLSWGPNTSFGINIWWSDNSGTELDNVLPNNTTINASLPVYLKLVRSGSTYTGYYSPDGSTWTEVGSATVPGQDATQDAGMFVNSGQPGQPAQATFNGFSVSSS